MRNGPQARMLRNAVMRAQKSGALVNREVNPPTNHESEEVTNKDKVRKEPVRHSER
jgi:hypothetical protein